MVKLKTYRIKSDLDVEIEAIDEFDAIERWEDGFANECMLSVLVDSLIIKEV